MTCPTIQVPTIHGPVVLDRWTYMATLYDFNYGDRWTQLGWLVVFVAVFQLGHFACAQFLQHGER